jgi:hypothetical protein
MGGPILNGRLGVAGVKAGEPPALPGMDRSIEAARRMAALPGIAAVKFRSFSIITSVALNREYPRHHCK